MLLTPQIIEQAAQDIVNFWESSSLSDTDKTKILQMVHGYYSDKDEYVHDRYLGELAKRILDRVDPPNDYEK